MRQLKRAETALGGKGSTSASELDIAAPKLGIAKFRGAWPADRCPKLTNGSSCILNTDSSGMAGSHWVALYATPKHILAYDSFGRRVSTLAKPFKRMELVDTEDDAEQHVLQENCGQRCLAFILTAQNIGADAAMSI